MSANDSHDADDAARALRRIQAEIAAEAEVWRRREPRLERLERDIERAWAHLAPPGAAGPQEELLLDRVDRLSMIDVDAPLGERTGVRQVKGAIRKGTYWYLRYVSDQLNALHNVLGRLLRRMDQRLSRLEDAAGFHRDLDALLDAVPPPSAAVATAVAQAVARGPVVCCGDATGVVVESLDAAGLSAHGVADDADLVLTAVERGVDVRVGSPVDTLAGFEPGSLGAVVLIGFVERRTLPELLHLVGSAERALGEGDTLVVVADDPSARRGPTAELSAGRGLSAGAWAEVLTRLGWTGVETVEVPDARVPQVVVALRP